MIQHALRLSALALVSPLAGASILHVSPSGPYTTPQAAVDAAIDGDTILIAAGTYPGFTIQDEALSVAAELGATVTCENIVVRDVAAQKNVVLADLRAMPAAGGALLIANCAGSVRIQRCALRAGTDSGPGLIVGANIAASDDVVLRDCSISGGLPATSIFQTGGDAVYTQGSQLALYNCQLVGRHGYFPDEDSDESGGSGGSGLVSPDSFVLAHQTSFQGGHGGNGGDGSPFDPPGDGGDGGHGIELIDGTPPAQVVTRQCSMMGGNPGIGGPGLGQPNGMNGSPGLPVVEGTGSVTPAAQQDCLQVSTPLHWSPGTDVSITVSAVPGSVVALYVARDTTFLHNPLTDYALHLAAPLVGRKGIVSPSGQSTVSFHVPSLPPGVEAQTWYLQVAQTPVGSGPMSSLACVIVH